jgi:hypothetical protein
MIAPWFGVSAWAVQSDWGTSACKVARFELAGGLSTAFIREELANYATKTMSGNKRDRGNI